MKTSLEMVNDRAWLDEHRLKMVGHRLNALWAQLAREEERVAATRRMIAAYMAERGL